MHPTVQCYEYRVHIPPGPFPYDMLRHDRAWPVGGEPEWCFGDAPTARPVWLKGLNSPNVERWRSFNCTVEPDSLKSHMLRCDKVELP